MNPAERVGYLANLLRTLEGRKAEGRAARVVEGIAREIGATAQEREAAAREAEAPDRAPVYPARYSDRVRNLEDMLLLAMADEKLSVAERNFILEAQRAVGVEPAAWSKVSAECRERLRAFGAAAGDAGERVELEFPAQAAQTLPAALARRGGPGARPDTVRIALSRGEVADLLPELAEVSGVAGATVVEGEARAPFAARFAFLPCALARRCARSADSYCHYGRSASPNVFGCGELGMEWSGLAGWFACGDFTPEGEFRFDRARLAADLAARGARVALCPFFDPELSRAALSLLPGTVTPDGTSGFEYRRTFIARPGTHARTERVKVGSIEEERTFHADGIAPVSLEPARKIVDAARAALGRPPATLD